MKRAHEKCVPALCSWQSLSKKGEGIILVQTPSCHRPVSQIRAQRPAGGDAVLELAGLVLAWTQRKRNRGPAVRCKQLNRAHEGPTGWGICTHFCGIFILSPQLCPGAHSHSPTRPESLKWPPPSLGTDVMFVPSLFPFLIFSSVSSSTPPPPSQIIPTQPVSMNCITFATSGSVAGSGI